MLADLEPIDCLILDAIVREYLSIEDKKNSLFSRDLLSKGMAISEEDTENVTQPPDPGRLDVESVPVSFS